MLSGYAYTENLSLYGCRLNPVGPVSKMKVWQNNCKNQTPDGLGWEIDSRGTHPVGILSKGTEMKQQEEHPNISKKSNDIYLWSYWITLDFVNQVPCQPTRSNRQPTSVGKWAEDQSHNHSDSPLSFSFMQVQMFFHRYHSSEAQLTPLFSDIGQH